VWKPNIKKVRIVQNGTAKTISICTHCLRANKVTRAS
jgi:large subunit ribosomal protein L28